MSTGTALPNAFSMDFATALTFPLAIALMLSVNAFTSSIIWAARWMKNLTISIIAIAALINAPTGVINPITHLIPAWITCVWIMSIIASITVALRSANWSFRYSHNPAAPSLRTIGIISRPFSASKY
ncbi:hypothetical protein [Chryseobacterium gambrini]|uniref:hypothetical protein n=1 Tax=Chryseobacterium gambrini TaxID=373672 RepID=UPI003D0C9E2C